MLEVRNLTFDYGETAQGQPLFKDLTLRFGENERVALRAPSGFGKTTLCRLLSGYEKPLRGEVLVAGEPLPASGVCPVQLVGQDPQAVMDERMRLGDSLAEAHASLKAWRTLGVFGGKTNQQPPEAVMELLEALGIRPVWLHRFPHELSGGELQRFCIARALLAQPRFLVADEITTMLDAVSTARIWEVIESYLSSRSAGLVFVSHYDALVGRIATRVVDLTDEDGIRR